MKKKAASSPHKVIMKARSRLSPGWRVASSFAHNPLLGPLLTSLEHTFARSNTLIIATLFALGAGLLSLGVSLIFNYSMVSFSFLGIVFGLGFILGFIYEYLRQFSRRK